MSIKTTGATRRATKKVAPMTEYLCIGIYEDNGQRFADTIEAESAEAAETIAELNWPSVTWAGFVCLRDGAMVVEG